MVRQDRRAVIHYGPGDVTLCVVGRRQDVDLTVSADPRETNCGRCENTDVWKRAWKAEAKRAKVPAP